MVRIGSTLRFGWQRARARAIWGQRGAVSKAGRGREIWGGRRDREEVGVDRLVAQCVRALSVDNRILLLYYNIAQRSPANGNGVLRIDLSTGLDLYVGNHAAGQCSGRIRS